jgi:hypothetical protein
MDQQLLLPPVAKQSLSEADSLAMVRIFLNVSLACIAHMRELLPWSSSCFRVRYMGQINPDMDVGSGDLYSAFQDLAPKGVSRGQEIRILVRGGHRRADQILDMLVESHTPSCYTILISAGERSVPSAGMRLSTRPSNFRRKTRRSSSRPGKLFF